MPNLKQLINSHNNHLLRKFEEEAPNTILEKNTDNCNCRNKVNCPLQNNCMLKNIVYRANVKTEDENNSSKSYIGVTENSFKTRYNNHKSSFNNIATSNATELSNIYGP